MTDTRKETKIEPGSSAFFALLGAEYGYNFLVGDEYRQMQEYSKKIWDAALATANPDPWKVREMEASRAFQKAMPPDVAIALLDDREKLLEACKTFADWLDREEKGFLKVGDERGTSAGEAKWREWYQENLRICGLSQDLAHAAIAQCEDQP